MKFFQFIILFLIINSCKEKVSEKPIRIDHLHKSIKGNFQKNVVATPNVVYQKNRRPPSEKIKPSEIFVTMQNYNTGQGLALSSIISSYTDREGNLWFGTDGGGASRYNGKSFKNFTKTSGLAGNSVMCITQDHSGVFWFGTNGGGASRYDGVSFLNFGQSQGLADKVYCIYPDSNGNLWFGTNHGIRSFDGKTFTRLNISNDTTDESVTCIIEDKMKNILFGTSQKGLIVYDHKILKPLSIKNGLAGDKINCITVNESGNIWIGTDNGVSEFDGKYFKNYSKTDGLADNIIYNLIHDKSGNLWVGTYDGISLFNKTLHNFSTIAGLTNKTIRSITEDKSGNLWFGTYGGGINRFDGKSIIDITVEQGLSDNFVNSIIQDKNGNYWFGTQDNGADLFNKKTFLNYRVEQGLASNSIHSILCDKSGNLWFGSENGATMYDGKTFSTFNKSSGLADNNVWVTFNDNENNIWFGTDKGVTKYDGKYFTSIANVGASINKVRSIAEDNYKNIWIGTTGGGISCFDSKTIFNYTTEEGLADNTIYCITLDKKGNLWIGTDGGGISFLSNETIKNISDNKVISFENITSKDGLANDEVYDIIEDAKGNIIVGTNMGFTIIEGGYSADDKPFRKDKIKYYNQSTGYPVKDINVNAMYIDNSGIIWAGTGDKLISFDYNNIFRNDSKPDVIIQNIKINNVNISWHNLLRKPNANSDSLTSSPNITEEVYTFGHTLNDSLRKIMFNSFSKIKFDSITPFNPLPVNLVLPIKHNNITFDFTAIEPSRPYMVRYIYKLDGYDNEWNPLTEKTTADYGNMFEGEYTFRLKALSPDGIWSDEVNFNFKVLPPWFRTWWAYLSYVLLFIFSISAIVKWRERRLKKEKEILEYKVDIRTHELQNEKERSDKLLLNILPYEIAEELKTSGTAVPKDYEQVTVLFTDFKNFTRVSENLDAKQLVSLINSYYSSFDDIITKYGIEKIKTIGDSYMCVGGLPIENKTNPVDTVLAALEIRDFILNEKIKRQANNEVFFEMRIGLHTGSVVAGIVGVKKYAYDIWGDVVNIAASMEKSGEPGKVNISGSTYLLIKDKFKCTYRGPVQAKNKGMVDMYFVEELI